ncbi:putative efflux protein, MATE family [Cohaesibacter sp. ES.047]|uniref:MATE family efflux transporter n=1 Tax=Cohaesibacter sp. ES.047 TaxID=1798205 RepID=UPI000BB67871|nr:MATE family efflux transporter [Cohaesibacter sp. ES.047]SNY90162.1 putative efflux protein, MATE family [Cohaesibacter sp. ES.047]
MDNDNEQFESMSVPKAILKNAIPTIVGMIVILIYNIADTFFVGQTNDPIQVAAVSLATPVFLLFMATGNLIGIGGTSVISRAFGEKRQAYAQQVSSFCFYASWIVGILFSLVFFVEMSTILSAIGVSEDTIGPTRQYLLYIAPSAPFVIISIAFGNIVRAEGKAKQAMIGMMLGTALNILLDPIFIIGLDMGVAGAAVATLIGNIVSAGYFLSMFSRGRFRLSIAFKDFRIKGVLWPVVAIGVPAALNNVMMSTSVIILNNVLTAYGDVAIAAMGIASKVMMIAVLLQIGLGAGIQPLLGYSFGAGNAQRFRSILNVSMVYALVMGSVLTLVTFLSSDLIISAFIEDKSVVDQGVRFVHILLFSGPIVGVMFVFINTLQAMGAARESLVLSISRQGFVFIPMLFVMNAWFGLDGVVFAQPTADLVSVIMAVFLVYPYLKKYLPHDKETASLELGEQPAQ